MQAEAEPEDRKLSFCISKYFESLEGCKPNSIRRAKDYLDRFLSETGDIKVSRLRAHHLTDFLKGKSWSSNSVRQVIITINACLNYNARQDWIVKNPIKGKVEMPLAKRREDVMSPEDAERLTAAAAPEFKDVLGFLAGTGCRPIEARETLIERCDLEKGILMVPNKPRKKTGDEERPVFLSTAMIGMLEEMIGERTRGADFQEQIREQMEARRARKRMQRLCEELGIEWGARLYSSRHRFISDSINKKKIPAAMVALQSGHQNLKMLMKVYLHADTEAMRAELDKS